MVWLPTLTLIFRGLGEITAEVSTDTTPVKGSIVVPCVSPSNAYDCMIHLEDLDDCAYI